MANLRVDNISGSGGRNAIDGSVFFDGTGDYLSIDDSADLELGSGDFTFEGWFYFGNTGSSGTTFWGKWNSPNRSYTFSYVKSTGTYTFGYSTDGSAEVLLTSSALSADINTWVHFAAVRNGSSLKVYRNGISIIDASVGSATFYNATTDLYIGRLQSNTNYDYKGYVSNFRLIKGTALYTANFTPPTEKLKAIDGTVLLCCQDSDNSTQEATGKTITAYGNLDYSLVGNNLITNGNFDTGTVYGWTLASGSRSLGTGQSGTFGDGNHLVLTGGSMYQAFTTKIGRTYFVNAQSNGSDSSYISTSTSTGDAIITDIRSSPQTGRGVRGQKSFVATQTTYYVILSGGGTGNFDTVSVYEAESPKAPKVLPPVGVDEGVVFEGDTKVNSQGYMYFPTGDTSQRGRGRGIFIAVETNDWSNVMSYIQIQTLGEVKDFGDLIYPRRHLAGASSATRGVIGGGVGPSWPSNKTTEYSTLATTGNATSFGDLLDEKYGMGCMASSTRGIFSGGYSPSPISGNVNVMEYITFATTGNALDFGDQSDGNNFLVRYTSSGISNGTRGTIQGGYTGSGYVDTIVYVPNIASLSDTSDFGNLSANRAQICGCSDTTRGVFMGGYVNPANLNTIEYITIATTGNSQDFGDLTNSGASGSAVSNSIRGVTQIGNGNIINYVNIQTTGDAKDFGDLNAAGGSLGANASYSDSHGGLS